MAAAAALGMGAVQMEAGMAEAWMVVGVAVVPMVAA